jgi:hypothetical protein
MIRRLVFLLASLIVGLKAYELAWPLVDPGKVLTAGSYRGIEIGDTKAEIVSDVRTWTSRLKFRAYYIGEDEIFVPTMNPNEERFPPFSQSNAWLLTYPSFHKELIVLRFDGDRLASIEYRRDVFTP